MGTDRKKGRVGSFKWWERGRLCSSGCAAAPWAESPQSACRSRGSNHTANSILQRQPCQDRPLCTGRDTLEWQLLVDQGPGQLDPGPLRRYPSLRRCQHFLCKSSFKGSPMLRASVLNMLMFWREFQLNSWINLHADFNGTWSPILFIRKRQQVLTDTVCLCTVNTTIITHGGRRDGALWWLMQGKRSGLECNWPRGSLFWLLNRPLDTRTSYKSNTT